MTDLMMRKTAGVGRSETMLLALAAAMTASPPMPSTHVFTISRAPGYRDRRGSRRPAASPARRVMGRQRSKFTALVDGLRATAEAHNRTVRRCHRWTVKPKRLRRLARQILASQGG